VKEGSEGSEGGRRMEGRNEERKEGAKERRKVEKHEGRKVLKIVEIEVFL
jgi:hypothetical protein